MKKPKDVLTELIRKETDDKKRTILRHIDGLYKSSSSNRIAFTVIHASKVCKVSAITFRNVLRDLQEDGVIFFRTSFEGTTIEFRGT